MGFLVFDAEFNLWGVCLVAMGKMACVFCRELYSIGKGVEFSLCDYGRNTLLQGWEVWVP